MVKDKKKEGEASEVVRAFIAVSVDEAVRARLREDQERLRDSGARVSWVAPDKIHLTLIFLGEIFRGGIPKLREVIEPVATATTPFRFEVAELGFFGSPRSPRVIWAGVQEPSGVLMELQSALARELTRRAWVQERRPFKPHLTLGRVRGTGAVGPLTSALTSAKNNRYGWVAVDQVLLMRSELDPRGARYSLLHAFPLKGA